MMSVPFEIPTPDQIAEEPLRPLLCTVQAAASNLLRALYAECPDAFPDVDPPQNAPLDPALWTAPALAQAIATLLELLDLHDRALTERNASWRRSDISF